jgi:hypothetical protein
MAKITSKADLIVGTNLTVDEPNKVITLNAGGSLVAKDGVTLHALYSKLVDLWATSTYQDSPFPMYAIDALSGQFQIGTLRNRNPVQNFTRGISVPGAANGSGFPATSSTKTPSLSM